MKCFQRWNLYQNVVNWNTKSGSQFYVMQALCIIFFLCYIFACLRVTKPLKEMSTRNIFWGGVKGGRWVGLTTLPPSCADCLENLEASNSRNPQGLSRPTMGLFYLNFTGFSWFPQVFSWFSCVYKQMLRWFSRFQVATTCFWCRPPDLNLFATNFIFCIHVK